MEKWKPSRLLQCMSAFLVNLFVGWITYLDLHISFCNRWFSQVFWFYLLHLLNTQGVNILLYVTIMYVLHHICIYIYTFTYHVYSARRVFFFSKLLATAGCVSHNPSHHDGRVQVRFQHKISQEQMEAVHKARGSVWSLWSAQRGHASNPKRCLLEDTWGFHKIGVPSGKSPSINGFGGTPMSGTPPHVDK